MKRLVQISVFASLFLVTAASAQEYQNVNNQYGAPTYTGGTVASASESFALYNQYRNNNQSARQVTTSVVMVYPNPAVNFTRVVLERATKSAANISITNMNGEIVQSLDLVPNISSIDLDVSALPAGLYALQITETGKAPQIIKLYKTE